jgi:hypothetical protein
MVTTGIQERLFDLSTARWVTIKMSPSSNRRAVEDMDKLDLQHLSARGSPPDFLPLVVEGTLLPEVHRTADAARLRPDHPAPEPYQLFVFESWWIGLPLISYPYALPDTEPGGEKLIRSLSEIGLEELSGYERLGE